MERSDEKDPVDLPASIVGGDSIMVPVPVAPPRIRAPSSPVRPVIHAPFSPEDDFAFPVPKSRSVNPGARTFSDQADSENVDVVAAAVAVAVAASSTVGPVDMPGPLARALGEDREEVEKHGAIQSEGGGQDPVHDAFTNLVGGPKAPQFASQIPQATRKQSIGAIPLSEAEKALQAVASLEASSVTTPAPACQEVPLAQQLALATQMAPEKAAARIADHLRQDCLKEASLGLTLCVFEAPLPGLKRFAERVARSFVAEVESMGFACIEWWNGREWIAKRSSVLHDAMYDKYSLCVRVTWAEVRGNGSSFSFGFNSTRFSICQGNATLHEIQTLLAIQQVSLDDWASTQVASAERAEHASEKSRAAELQFMEGLIQLGLPTRERMVEL